MKVGDRVRVVKGTIVYLNRTGVITGDDGMASLPLWVQFDDGLDPNRNGTPFDADELRVIED